MKQLKSLTLLFTIALPYAVSRNEGTMFADSYGDCVSLFENFDATLKLHYIVEGNFARGKPYAPPAE